MKRHNLWMVIGCTLPLLLIFILPAFGISGGTSLFIFIILMFACHIFMMGGHHGRENGHVHQKGDVSSSKDIDSSKKEGKHGCH